MSNKRSIQYGFKSLSRLFEPLKLRVTLFSLFAKVNKDRGRSRRVDAKSFHYPPATIIAWFYDVDFTMYPQIVFGIITSIVVGIGFIVCSC